MDQQQVTDEQLWEFIDGFSSSKEQDDMKLLITRYPELNKRYNVLLQLKESLGELPLDAPSMRFTTNVLEQIIVPKYKPAFSYINKWMVRGIAAFFILLMAILVVPALSLPSNSIGDNLVIRTENIFKGPYLQYILMLNVVGILLLLDAHRNKRKARTAGL